MDGDVTNGGRATLKAALARLPLVAVLRGLRPEEAEDVGAALMGAGFAIMEVPLNSPQPFDSIRRLADRFGGQALVGAGTVLNAADVARVADAGGRLVVSPDANPAVIAAAASAGLVALPGVATPTEAFAALAAGAAGLKMFPAEGMNPGVLKAWRAVLPPDVPVLPVGGIGAGEMAAWVTAGASGFGMGTSLYKPGDDAASVGARAMTMAAAWISARG